tara:strand:- start:1523 stop:1834 length:312 start_codon:yes stop_codon:yes gene_type:complete
MTYVTVADFIKIIKAPFFVRGDGTKVIETAQINNEQLSQSQLIQQGEIEAEQERQRQEAIRKAGLENLKQQIDEGRLATTPEKVEVAKRVQTLASVQQGGTLI